jgi:DUF1016 N-terminal domain
MKHAFGRLVTQRDLIWGTGRTPESHPSRDTLLLQTYLHIGQHIVGFERGGKEKADYGSGLLDKLAKDQSALHGRGFSRSNVFYIRKLYLSFQNRETLSHKLI